MRVITIPVLTGLFFVANLFPAPLAYAGNPEPGEWGMKAPLLEANSEFALAALDGSLYVVGGYPKTRVTTQTVQVYDIAADRWSYGPDYPIPINHGMVAAVNGKLYSMGGQIKSSGTDSYTDRVFELDPAIGKWVERSPMPTRRSAAVPVVLDGKIYVAGGRPPHGHDFAVYDPAADRWETLPDVPSLRNHIAGAAIAGKIHIVGGRLGGGYRSDRTAAHEVYDPATNSWTSAKAMLRARSGINGVMARGCFHVWGGEYEGGLFPDHDVYDPRADTWTHLPDMPHPVHGVTGSAYANGLIWVVGGGTEKGGRSGSFMNQVYKPAMDCE